MFVLALDGLEFDFVKRWNLKVLQQKYCGLLEVPIHPIRKVPVSSQVWACFLTGDWEGSVKYADFTYGSWWKDSMYKVLQFIRSLMPFGVGLMKQITKADKLVKAFPELYDSSFVELTSCSLLNVPYFNFNNFLFTLHSKFSSNKLNMFEVINLGLSYYEDLKHKILDKDLKSSPFTFAYVPFPDFIQHYCFSTLHKVLWHYLDLQQFVYELKEKFEGKFLIVSDHGFSLESMSHSCHGFYSANFPLKVSKITDFYNIFMEEFG